MLLNSQTRKKTQPPKYMTIKKLTQHALINIHNDLEEKNIYEKLDQSFIGSYREYAIAIDGEAGDSLT